MANVLRHEKQEAVIRCLVEGSSIRTIERIVGVHRDTVMRFAVRVGEGCERLMDGMMRNLVCQRLQLDEIWCFVQKKQRHLTVYDDPTRTGDMWTFVAIDSDTKLVPTYRIGRRNAPTAAAFVADLKSRLVNRVQLSSDGLDAYVASVEAAFGANVDYGQIVKFYESEPIGPGRYSPPHVTATERTVIIGNPDRSHISTSHVERQNVTMRMQMRRFTRLTNGFSKKIENLKAAVGLHFAHYNLVRIHGSLRVTPAMEAGITNRVWKISDLIEAGTAT
jgi:IS1 family transposase